MWRRSIQAGQESQENLIFQISNARWYELLCQQWQRESHSPDWWLSLWKPQIGLYTNHLGRPIGSSQFTHPSISTYKIGCPFESLIDEWKLVIL